MHTVPRRLLLPPLQAGLTDANYCDANTSPSHWCTEIDITEGNVAGYQSALHTKQGHADGNVCDADGCYAKLGAAVTDKLGGWPAHSN